MNLNKRSIDALSLPGKPKPYAKIYHDDALRGFALRVTSGGAKTFIVNKKVNGNVFRMNIGAYGEFTPEQARKKAQMLLGQLASGINPAKKKVSASEAITFKQAYEDYLKTRKNLKPRTIIDYTSLMRNIFPDWADLPLTAISREMVSARHSQIGKNHQARANNAFKLLNAVFNFAVYQYADREGHETINNNPVIVLTQTRAWFKNKRRDTKINHEQLPAWFKAVHALRSATYNSIELSVKYYLMLVLFTGLRKEEAAPLIWADAASAEELKNKSVSYLSLKEKILFIDDSKNGLEHVLPLSNYIYQLFSDYRKTNLSRFVFPGVDGTGPIKESRKVIQKISNASQVTFTLHDLRRTFATMANEIGIPAYTIKRLLNHKTSSSDVTAGYIVNDLTYLCGPVERIANYMLSIAMKEAGG